MGKKLDVFFQFNERDVLGNPGKVSHKIAESFAVSEFDKYRIVQDKLFESDFDMFMISWKSIGIAIFAVFIIVFMTMMYATKKMKRENILDAIREENI